MSTSTVFVLTLNGGSAKWSRYVFPFLIDAFTQLGNVLYIRHGDYVSAYSEDVTTDEVAGTPIDFPGRVQWPWLDFGQAGVDKELEGFDLVATGSPEVSIGWDQTDLDAFTDPYALPPDTLPGGIIPLQVVAPTLSVRLDWDSGAWSVKQVGLYLKENAEGSA